MHDNNKVKMFCKRTNSSNSKIYQGIILCMFGFICELSCTEYKSTEKNSHIISGTRQIEGDENFSVAKNVNRKGNYSEIFSMQNEIVPSCIRTKGYENYKLLSIKVSCRDKYSASEMLSGGTNNKTLHAKHKFEKILHVLQQEADVWYSSWLDSKMVPFISNNGKHTTHINDHATCGRIDVLVAPSQTKHLFKFLENQNVEFQVKSESIQENINNEGGTCRSEDHITITEEQDIKDFMAKQGHLKNVVKRSTSTIKDWLQIVGLNVRSIFQPRPDPAQDRLINLFAQSRRRPRLINSLNSRDNLLQDFPSMHWHKYQRLGTIYAYMHRLQLQHPHLVEVITIGRTDQGRDILVAKIAKTNSVYPKKSIFIEAGIHAREWISPAAATYLLMELVENNNANDDVLELYDVYILPVANPDGYEYTHTTNRLWRKNRAGSRTALGQLLPVCAGVDLNRNFGYKWGGVSLDPRRGTQLLCLETYMGSKPFSEKESTAIRRFIMSYPRGTFEMYLSLHSYGEKIIYPWSYSSKKVEDWRELDRVGRVMARAMYKSSNAKYKYRVGSTPHINYIASGGSDDWARGEAGIKWVFLMELPDKGFYGFLLPPREIKSAVKTVFQGFRAGISEINNFGYHSNYYNTVIR